MKEGLVYRGKRAPVTFKNVQLKGGVTFPDTSTVVWLEDYQAAWLVKTNPIMFHKVQDIQPPVVPVAKAQMPEVEKFVCDKCGRQYSDERWYDKHVDKCTDGDMPPDGEPEKWEDD